MTFHHPPAIALNLTAWFVTAPPAAIPAYTVLEEAMETHPQLLHETGNVNQLLIDNPGDLDLFLQAGDIVKGGRQDRTIGADFIVPARSSKLPLPVFCVESARWHKRRKESDTHFSKSSDFASSKKLRAALRAKKNQGEVWNSVAEHQEKISHTLGVSLHSPDSPTSLQLSYEMKETADAGSAYTTPLESAPLEDTTGVIWAINGTLSHADLYANAILFRKVWKKLLSAAALEAISERPQPARELPADITAVSQWLQAATQATPEQETLPPRTRLTTRRHPAQLRFETHDTQHTPPVHLSILAQ